MPQPTKTRSLVPFTPDYASPPGQLLEEVLRTKQLTQADLADRTGLSTKYVNQIIKKNASVSAETAVRLEAVTDVPAQIWMRLEADFRAAEACAEREKTLASWTGWLDNFNLAELKQRGIITSASRAARTVEELLRFFAISSPDSWNRVWQPSMTRFRRSPSFVPEMAPTTAWLRLGQRRALEIDTDPFSEKQLLLVLPKLRELTRLEPSEAMTALQNLCASVGVAVVYAAELRGCRASGATWWATPDKAVVVLTNRGQREDRFWFSFFHEIGHIVKHAKRDTFIDKTGPDDEGPPWEDLPPASGFIDDGSRDSILESEADDFASTTLILPSALHRVRIATTASALQVLADELGISAGVVVGRWQFETGDYAKFNQLRRVMPHEPFYTP